VYDYGSIEREFTNLTHAYWKSVNSSKYNGE